MDSPVLFLIFNRPDTTAKVFAAICKERPKKLFVAADGPRENKPGEKEKCEETRKITEKIDWPCKVKRLYRKNNLGCKIAISSAIDWFFKNVDEGIILEDDCLPSESFFIFCDNLLEKYRNNKKVMMISGDNFHRRTNLKTSYYFSQYPHIWGWASWKRAWKEYRVNIPQIKLFSQTKTPNYKRIEKMYWNSIFIRVYRGQIDTWDYQWVYALFNNNGLIACPKLNLVENIGFGKDATHTIKGKTIAKKNIEFPLIHPENVIANELLDRLESKNNQGVNILTVVYNLIKSIL